MGYREEERTLSAPDGWSVPEPEVDGTTTRHPVPVRLDALYYDTADLRLLAHGVTLRRRTGGHDAGWHLKLPAPGDARDEVRRPLGGDGGSLPDALDAQDAPGPPDDLAALVVGLARGDTLVPVGRIRTTRRVTVLSTSRPVPDEEGGDPLVEIAEDEVRAERLVEPVSASDDDAAEESGAGVRRATDGDPGGGRTASAWREIEVELLPAAYGTDDPQELLAAVVDSLVDAGARPGPSGPKLARALEVRDGLAPWGGPSDARHGVGDDPTAGDVVAAYLHEQVEALTRWDPEVRRDTPDAVHKSRVAARRLRSALATFRPFLDRTATEPVRDELRWWGRVLGEARDAEVARDRIDVVLDRLPGELVVGPVRARVVDELDGAYRAALRDAVAQMSGRRYLDLLTALDDLVADPALTSRARRAAADELPRRARKAWRRTSDRVRAARVAEGERREELLHDARKAAKRARYAGEALAPSLGKDAARFARRLEAVQDALGEHHDAVGLAATLRRLGMQANLSGENGFSYGLLVGVERQRAQTALEDFERAWERASRKRVRRWTSS